MNWFWYGYTEVGGHGLYGEVVAYLRRKVRDFITRQAPYDRLPEQIPYVGHCSLDDGLWLVVGKPSGTGTFYGCVADEREYGRHGFSPYKLISADPPTEPVLAVVGSPLESDEFPLPVDSVDYLQFAARLFEGLGPRERQVTHHSIVSKEQSSDGAFFVFERGSGDACLDEFSREEDEEEVEERSVPVADEIRALRETVAHLTKSVELADQRLRDELAGFGAEFERRIEEGIVVGMRGEMEGVDRVLKSATDWPMRLERVEDAVRAQSDRLDAVKDAVASSPTRKWRVVRIAAVIVILAAVFVSLYSDIDDLKSIASEIRTEVWGPDATLTNVALGVDALKDDVAQVKQTFSDPDGTLIKVAEDIEMMLSDVATVKDVVSGEDGALNRVVADVGAVKTDIEEVKQTFAAPDGKLSQVAAGVAAVKTNMGSVKEMVSGSGGKLTQVIADVGVVKSDVATVKETVSGEPGTLSQVASDVKAMRSDYSEMKQIIELVRQAIIREKTENKDGS